MGLYARVVVVSVGQVAPEVLHAVRDHGEIPCKQVPGSTE